MNSMPNTARLLHRDLPALVVEQRLVLPQADEDWCSAACASWSARSRPSRRCSRNRRRARSAVAGSRAETARRARAEVRLRARTSRAGPGSAGRRRRGAHQAVAQGRRDLGRRTRPCSWTGRSSTGEITSSTAPVTAGGDSSSLAGDCWPCRAIQPCAFCAHTSSELYVDIEPGRDRALLLRERDLRLGLGHARARAAPAPSGLPASFGLREREHVAAHHIAACRGDSTVQPYSLPGGLARRDELALGPVAHDLHAGLALDHQRRRVVPVAAGRARIDVAAQLADRSRRPSGTRRSSPQARRACPRTRSNMSRPPWPTSTALNRLRSQVFWPLNASGISPAALSLSSAGEQLVPVGRLLGARLRRAPALSRRASSGRGC